MPLNEAQIRKECKILKDKGLTDIAVVGVFSPLDISGKQEARVKQIVLEEIPEADVVLSRDSKCNIPAGPLALSGWVTDFLSIQSANLATSKEKTRLFSTPPF